MNPGEIVGVGNTATVYEWENGKVVKLFREGYPYQDAIREFENAMDIMIWIFQNQKHMNLLQGDWKRGAIK